MHTITIPKERGALALVLGLVLAPPLHAQQPAGADTAKPVLLPGITVSVLRPGAVAHRHPPHFGHPRHPGHVVHAARVRSGGGNGAMIGARAQPERVDAVAQDQDDLDDERDDAQGGRGAAAGHRVPG